MSFDVEGQGVLQFDSSGQTHLTDLLISTHSPLWIRVRSLK